MILIGQFDSPFVRRVAVAMDLYGLAYEHRPWSAFGDADRLAAYNPLRRVPTLVLDDGEALLESGAILDHLDELAGPGRALIAGSGPERRRALRWISLATGMADKAVAMVYGRLMHQGISPEWRARMVLQIRGVLDALTAERAGRPGPFWFGAAINHADIALACAFRFLGEAHPDDFDPAAWPLLARHAAHCEALPAFAAASQPLILPR